MRYPAGLMLGVLLGGTFMCVPTISLADVINEDYKITSPSNGARFGSSVALSGNRIVIGATHWGSANEGQASFYEFDGSQWNLVYQVTGTGTDNLGTDVDLDGDYAIVGIPLEDAPTDSGEARIYHHDGSGWSLQATLHASSPSGNDQFGSRTAIHGDTAMVAAWFNGDIGEWAGAVYVFKRQPDNSWEEQTILYPPNRGAANTFFGSSLDLIDGRAIICRAGDVPAAFVFDQQPDSSWAFTNTLHSVDSRRGIGPSALAVAAHGNLAIVGDSVNETNGYRSGLAFIYQEQDDVWSLVATLEPADADVNRGFGHDVDIDGDTAVISSFNPDGNDTGGAHVFQYDSSAGWTEAASLAPTDLSSGDRFGYALDVENETALVSSQYDGGTSGSAYLFTMPSESAVQWAVADGGNGHWYEVILMPDGISWTDAKAAAEAADGYLATATTQEELDFINSLDFAGTDKGWLGGYQDVDADDYAEPDGGWRWVTSESWEFIGWWFDAPADNDLRNYMQLAYGQCQDEQDLPTEGEWYVIEYGTPTATQWTTGDGGNGNWYLMMDEGDGYEWNEAIALAESMGGHLASITTAEEDDWVYNNIDRGVNGWLGGWQDINDPDYSEPGGAWKWLSGEAWSYANWNGGGPDNDLQPGPFEDCLMYCCGGNWNDMYEIDNPGNYSLKDAIIEWSADCNGDGIVDFGQILDGTFADLDGNGIPDCCDDESCLSNVSACCFGTICNEVATDTECTALGGTWQDGLGCDEVTCSDGTVDVCPTCYFTDIQSAIDAAPDGATIEVGPGTYQENLIIVDGRSLNLISTDGAEATTLDGGNTGSILYVYGSATTSVTGFTIQNGSGTDLGTNHFHGGGFCIDSGDLVLDSCHVTGNTAKWGGGAYLQYGHLTVNNCLFSNNSVVNSENLGEQGGAICTGAGNLTVTDSQFTNNSSGITSGDGIGGAIACDFDASNFLTVSNSNFTGNYAGARGGAIETHSAGDNITISSCVFSSNSSRDGGAIYSENTILSIDGCSFSDNLADVMAGALMVVNGGAGSAVSSCDFTGNIGSSAGAIFLEEFAPTISNCTFSGNDANAAESGGYGRGGAIFLQIAPATIDSCVIQQNTAAWTGGGIYISGTTSLLSTTICGNTPDQIIGSWSDQGNNQVSESCLVNGAVQWATADGGNGHGYQVVIASGGISWTDADIAAHAAGGHLATVGSEAELEFINSLDFGGYSKGWLGGYQNMAAADYAEPDGGWRWVTGEPWSFVGWFSDAPADDPDHNYLQLAYGQCQDEQDVANEGEWYVIEFGTAESMEWSIAEGGNGHFYSWHAVDQNWAAHDTIAMAHGGHLVTITTAEEQAHVETIRDSSPPDYGNSGGAFLAGGYQDSNAPDFSEPDGGWNWVTGEPWSYMNWAPNQPDNNGNADRLGLSWQDQGTWDDNVVTTEWFAIIEWSADCNGDGIVDFGQILDGSLEDLDTNGVPDCCDDGSCLDDGDPTTSQWINPAGGSFHDADNWSTSAPPNQNMTAILEIDTECTITFEDDAQTLSLLVRNGNITFDIGAAEYELLATDSSALVVGEANGDLATLAIASGQLTSGETLIGRDQGAMGSLVVQGSGTRVDINALIVGARGEAYLDLSGGARLDTFETYIGNLTGSHGFVSMSGYSAANDTTWNCTSNFTIGYGRLDIEFPALLNVETGSLTINKSGRLAGNGAIHGRMINWGVVEPQWNGPNLELHGTYQQFGLFAANLGSLTDYSTLDIEKEGSFTGWADIKGGLIARLENGFDPPVSSTFSVMNATDGLEGSYSVALMPDLGEEKFMTVVYRYSPLRGSYGVDLVVVAFEDVLGFDEPDFVELVGQPEALVVTDYDNDGDDDIIVSTQGWISIWNNNDTNFVLHQQLDNGGETAVDLVAGYFNEDEWIDIAVANADAGTFAIAINDNGTFTTLVDYNCNVNPVGIAAADFNGDGRDDIAVACAGTYPSDGVVQLWRSQPSGNTRSVTFVKDDEVPVGAVPSGIDPGEVEEDKDLDLVVALASEDSIGVLYNNFNTRGGATINFSHDIEDDQYAVGDGPRDIAFKDLDADGYDDIVTANPLDGSISILLNTNGKGDRDFLEAVNLPIGDQAQSVSLTDLDGDGDRDIAVVAIKDGDVDRSLFVLRNDSIVNGNPTGQLLLAPAETFAINGIPILVDDGNIDADLLPDLITINEAGTGLRGERIGSLGLVRHPSSCDGDIDGDGVVNIDDLLTVIETWGPEGGEGDLDGDGDADIDDLLIVISNWGQCSN